MEDPYNRKCRISEERVTALETEIDNLEKLCPRPVTEKLKGNSSLAAEIDIARTVARRAECSLAQVSVKFGADAGSRKFLNRLSDYFFILARYTENAEGKAGSYEMQKTEIEVTGAKAEAKNIKTQNTEAEAVNTMDTLAGTVNINEAVIREVLKRIGVQTRITLDIAKKLIDRIEQEALRRGAHAVISVCNAEGNPIAVHVMDGAFLVSFDAAMKKAYTAAAVRMSTMEFGKMAQRRNILRCRQIGQWKDCNFWWWCSAEIRRYSDRWSWYQRWHRRRGSQSGRIRTVCSAGINIGNLPCLSYSAELFQMYLIKRIVISSGHLPGEKCSGLFFIFVYISRESCPYIS